MQAGFPIALLSLLRCSGDGGELRLEAPAGDRFVVNATIRCCECGREHDIRHGILSLLRPDRLHPESANELHQRDAKNDSILAGQAEWQSPLADALETEPTLHAVGVDPGMTVLELGCGTGRYTLAFAERAAAVVAVDFSLPGLQLLRQKLPRGAQVAVVQADVTEPYAAGRRFDRALSTLHSNLPGAAMRTKSLRHVAHALKTSGRAVISMHHYSGRDFVARVPAEGRYPDSGIYRYYLRRSEAQAEIGPFFQSIRYQYLYAGIPGFRSAAPAKAAARVPGIRGALARLFLAVSERPYESSAHAEQSRMAGVA